MKNNIQIHVRNVSKSFRDVNALDDVSINFGGGNLYGVIGPAGAGKTTLFRIILQLMRPDSGNIKYQINGDNITFRQFAPHIAYMPQSQSLYADLSVGEHLDFFKKLYGISDDDYVARRRQLLHMTRMDEFQNRVAGKLSGGMYKKLGLMCAMLRAPNVMILDEPTNGVDPISRREFWGLLNKARNSGILVIISTAYMDEAQRCDDVVLMERGHVLDIGEPRDLLNRYGVDDFDQMFIARGARNETSR